MTAVTVTVWATCPECGEDFTVDPGRPGSIPTYCSRHCQVRSLRAGRTITITVDEEARRLLDREAARVVVSTRRYVELLVAQHADDLVARGQRR